MNLSNLSFPPHGRRYKMGGGGGGGAPAGPIPAPPAPPASNSDLAVTQQKQEAKKQAKDKQGITSTILGSAGAGAPSPAGPAGKNTVLGGG